MAPDISSQTRSIQRALIHGNATSFNSTLDKFDALAEAWAEQSHGRSVRDYNHFAHLQIIGMGPVAIPLLLDRLERGESKWIYALKCISGERLETPEMQGDAEAVVRAWLEWGNRYRGTHGRIAG